MNSTQRTESSTASMGDHVAAERAVVAGAETPSQIDTARGTDESGSFIQVVVQKHHQKKDSQAAAAQTSPRLPAASSPIAKAEHASKDTQLLAGCGDGPALGPPPAPGVYMLPHPLLLTYPGLAPQLDARDAYSWCPGRRTLVEVSTSAQSSSSFKKLVRAARPLAPARKGKVPPSTTRGTCGDIEEDVPLESKKSFWHKFALTDTKIDIDEAPERVEVYYFEQGGSEYLCAQGGSGGALAQWARRTERRADRCFGELLAVPTCLALLPVSFALHVLRAALRVAGAAALGAAGALGDGLVKPALVVAFNALVRGPLAAAGAAGAAARAALAPVVGLLGDVAGPLARVLAAPRLLHVAR